MIKHPEEFKYEAVRIALTSGLPCDRVASDLGIGKSTLGKWVSQYRPSDLGVFFHRHEMQDGELINRASSIQWGKAGVSSTSNLAQARRFSALAMTMR